MSRKIRIVTSSFATLESTQPPFNLHSPNPEDNLKLASDILESAISYKPDVVLLPETFKLAGVSYDSASDFAEQIPGPTFDMLAKYAKRGKTYIAAGHMISEHGKIINKAVILDRAGNLAGSYAKKYPVEGEINRGVQPGDANPVFDLDFGRVGVSVCFDLNWREIWKDFAEQKIDLALWLSAYEGGFPLQSYAWEFQYPIVSSVWPYHARVVDITGRIVSSTSRWSRIAYHELNLDRALFHTDLQMQQISQIQKKYGNGVLVKTFTEEHLFLLENNLENITIKDIIREFNLVTYCDYIDRCTEYRGKYL